MTPKGARRRRAALVLLAAAALVTGACRTWTAREERAAVAYNEGNALREAGRAEEALQAYRRALEEDPGFTAAAFNASLILVEIGRYAEGREMLDTLHRQDPKNLRILRAQGWAAWEAGESEAAIGYYRAVLAVFEADEDSLEALATVYETIGRPEESLGYRRFLVRLHDDATALRRLGDTLLACGKHQEALEAYRRALTRESDDPEALEGGAAAAMAVAEYREALTYLERIVESPDEAGIDARFTAARILIVEIGDYAAGIEALESALDAGFADAGALDDLLESTPPSLRSSVRNLITATEETDG